MVPGPRIPAMYNLDRIPKQTRDRPRFSHDRLDRLGNTKNQTTDQYRYLFTSIPTSTPPTAALGLADRVAAAALRAPQCQPLC